MKKKIIPLLTLAAIGATILVAPACKIGGTPEEGEDKSKITYETFNTSTVSFQDNHDVSLNKYNSDLYYLNEWKAGYGAPNATAKYFPDMGDPMIVYDDGYYYAFGTRGADAFQCFRTKDFTEWKRLDDAFDPTDKDNRGSWSTSDLWAPDIQKIGGKWYLYYTAAMKYSDGATHCQIGVAVSDNVYGPYVQFTGKNGDGENITIKDTPFTGLDHTTILDQNVFVDDDGEMYMYFSYDTKTGTAERKELSPEKGLVSEIWMVKMKDAVTWDLTTLKPLISPGYKNYTDKKRTIEWETWSPSFTGGMQCCEGPYMIKHGGKYILTYCANSFVDAEYAVGYAVSDNPMGPFEKPDDYYLQNMLLGVPGAPGTYISNRYKGFTRGTGHAAIFKTGDGGDYMFAYHAHFNREKWDDEDYGPSHSNWRALSVDYLYFDENGSPYTNGPTYSLQRTPTNVSGLKNLAPEATVRAEGENAKYLNDNYTNRTNRTALLDKTKKHEPIKEAEFKAGTRSIEIKFNKQVTVKALNIYNSCDLDHAIDFIDQIDFGNGNGIVNALFNTRYINDDFIFPHSAFTIELGTEVVTDRIVITITCDDHDFALGEIEVMCKQ